MEKVWKHTSKWRQQQLEQLRIKFVNVDATSIAKSTASFLPEEANCILLPGIDISTAKPTNELHGIQLRFYNRIVQVHDFKDEPPVDSVVRDLLDYTGFEGKLLHF